MIFNEEVNSLSFLRHFILQLVLPVLYYIPGEQNHHSYENSLDALLMIKNNGKLLVMSGLQMAYIHMGGIFFSQQHMLHVIGFFEVTCMIPKIIIHQIFFRACHWSKCILWLNVAQLDLENIWENTPSNIPQVSNFTSYVRMLSFHSE